MMKKIQKIKKKKYARPFEKTNAHQNEHLVFFETPTETSSAHFLKCPNFSGRK
jgi:hypothetical protein